MSRIMTPSWERAVHDGDVATLGCELQAGGDVNARDRYGQTALMLAAVNGDRVAVTWLIRHGASLDHTAKFRLSALMLATVNGHREIVRMLIAAGADVTLRGSGAPGFFDMTAYELARERGDVELQRLLGGDH